jgi:hypothetical protein
MRGGVMSGWAASRTGQLSDLASHDTFGGYQGGHRPRWPIPRPHVALRKANIGDGRPTSQASATAKPSRTDRASEFA